jgi:NAD(P)-dependent dehydrogenase (short-subunit alcohol dehydrogenase family)
MTSTLPQPRPPAAPVPSDGAAVLVTGAGGPAGVAVVRRLVALGHRVVAGDADSAAAGGALAHAAVTLPRGDHPRFVEALLGVCAAHGVDALVSTVAEELPHLATGAGRLAAAGVATWLPPVSRTRRPPRRPTRYPASPARGWSSRWPAAAAAVSGCSTSGTSSSTRSARTTA